MALNDDLNNARNSARGVNEEIGSLYDQLRGVTSEIKGQATEISKAREAFRAFEKGAQDLKLQQEGINRLSDDQVKKLEEQLTKQRAIAAQEVERLKSQSSFVRNLDEELELLKQQGDTQEGLASYALQQIHLAQDLSEEQKAILSSFYDQTNVMDEILDQTREEKSVRDEINKSLGITGGVLKGLNEVGGGFTKAFKLDKVAADMEEFADETIRAEGSVSRLRVLGVGLQSAFKNAFATLTDPSVIIAGAIKGFGQVDKANVAFGRQTGQTLNTFSTAIDASNTHFITMADYIKTASELTKELGQNATAIFGPEDLMEAAEMTEAMGMTAKESANLAKFSKINGGNIKAQNEALVKGVNASNAQNRTAVAAGDILKDVANVSEEIAISYAGYPESLASAAATAKGLGMELSDVDKIAGSLLNFEQSIANELEAELLTGQSLNLEKARELALANDLEGVAKELSSQGITSAKFSQMNRLQQEAQAKALGMSRQEMAKMLLAQQIGNDLSGEGLNAAQKQTLEQLKQEEASEKFKKSIEKIQQALAPVVGFFASILSSVTGFLTQTYLIYPILGVIALSYIPKIASGFAKVGKSIAEGAKGVKDIAKGVLNLATGKGSGALKEAVMGKSDIDPVKKSGDQMKPGGGKGIKENLSGLGDGLKKMAGGQVTQGVLNLALAGPALLLSLPSIPFLLFMGLTPLNQLETNFTSLGNGLKEMGGGPVFAGIGALALAGPALAIANLAIPFLTFMALPLGPLIKDGFTGLAEGVSSLGNNFVGVAKGALALAILGASLIPAAFAFSLLAGVDVGSIIAFSVALPLLALAAAGLGFISPFIMAGAGALAVLGLALIPASTAFGMIAGLDTAAIISFSTGIGILATTVAGLGFLSPFIIFGSFALMALGLALVPLSEGFEKMASANVEGLVNSLQSLATVAPQLFGVAAGLGAISAGLASMAFAGFAAIPVIGALTALGAVSGALSSIFGGEEEETKDEGSMKAIEQKLDQLIAIVSAGGDVYIDGSKVGKTLQLASSKMG